MITDNEAIQAMNTLIDYCTQIIDSNPIKMDGESYLKVCNGCKISSKCHYLLEGHTLWHSIHLPLEGTVEVEKLAPNMAAAIMNRRD